MNRTLLPLILSFVLLAACNRCDSNQASNKLLALSRVQARMMGDGGEGMVNFGAAFTVETAPISELIAKGDFSAACAKADEIAAKYKIDLAKEMSGMVSIEQLAKDGGKGTGKCSVTDASKKQMEYVTLLQADVAAGKIPADSMHKFSEKTRRFGELLLTDPSKACDLLDRAKEEVSK